MSRAEGTVVLPVARVLLISITVLLMHVFLFSRFSLFAVRPEPFLLVTVLGALKLGPSGGTLLGVLTGLARDFISDSPLGIWVLICGLLGLIVGTIHGQMSTERQRTTRLLMVMTCTLAGLLLYPALAFTVSDQRYPQILRYVTILLIATLWNVLLMPFFELIVRRLFTPKAAWR